MDKFKNSFAKEMEEPVSRMCHMKGCPLVGTMSDNSRGGGPWWCSYHFQNRSSIDFTPEERIDLQRIAGQYNKGKRDYGGPRFETREEMHARVLDAQIRELQRRGREATAETQAGVLPAVETEEATGSASMAFQDTR